MAIISMQAFHHCISQTTKTTSPPSWVTVEGQVRALACTCKMRSTLTLISPELSVVLIRLGENAYQHVNNLLCTPRKESACAILHAIFDS
eukprot:765496-Hanusia_phi.AAC.6